MGQVEDQLGTWVDANPPPAETEFSGRRVGKLLLALFACSALGTLPQLFREAATPPTPKPAPPTITLQELEEADKRGQLGSGFKRILEMRKQQGTK